MMAAFYRRRQLLFLLGVFYITYLFLNLYILGNNFKSLSELSKINDQLDFSKHPKEKVLNKGNKLTSVHNEEETSINILPKKTNYDLYAIENQFIDETTNFLQKNPLEKPKEFEYFYPKDINSKTHKYNQYSSIVKLNIHRNMMPYSDDINSEPTSNKHYLSLERLNLYPNFDRSIFPTSKYTTVEPLSNKQYYSSLGELNVDKKVYQNILPISKHGTLAPLGDIQYSSIVKLNTYPNLNQNLLPLTEETALEPLSNIQYSSPGKLSVNKVFYKNILHVSKNNIPDPNNKKKYPSRIKLINHDIQQNIEENIESQSENIVSIPRKNQQYSLGIKLNTRHKNDAVNIFNISYTMPLTKEEKSNEKNRPLDELDNFKPPLVPINFLFKLNSVSQNVLNIANPLLHFNSIENSKINSLLQNDLITQEATKNPLLHSFFSFFNPGHSTSNNQISVKKSIAKPLYLKPKKDPSLIIDTTGCKIPKMSPWDPSILHLIELHNPLKCSDIPLFMTPISNGIIHLNASILEQYYNTTVDNMKCYYQSIYRKYEDPGNVRENDYTIGEVKNLVFDEPMQDEYIAAQCHLPNNYTHEQYFPLVRIKKEVEEVKSKIVPPSPLNVILLGIDSVSKLNFLRHFMRTKAFLRNKMKSFDMKGYTKVGDNTFPNLVPLLTGHFVEYYWNESLRDTFFFDNISLIWKDYARHGYRTFFAEDSPFFATFNYLKRGFHDPPTDYYYRPLALAIENSLLRAKARVTNSPCLNSEMETDLMYDYLINFVKTMDKRPYFAFCMESMLTHDFLNKAGRNDVPATRLLRALHDEGALNSSALIIFSDHGLRFGEIRHTYIGKFEERMPFMYIYFPKWFLDQHPDFQRNLDINQDRLVTLFDVHATMKHILYIDKTSQDDTDELGVSLFNEIPEKRTCSDANIHQHWCPCNNFNQISINNPVVLNVSNNLVNYVNELLLPHADVCETLEIEEVTDARFGKPYLSEKTNIIENELTKFDDKLSTSGDYLITLSVKPGGGVFEGTIRYFSHNLTADVLGVSRINVYGETSWCIDSPQLKLYCYCKTQKEFIDET